MHSQLELTIRMTSLRNERWVEWDWCSKFKLVLGCHHWLHKFWNSTSTYQLWWDQIGGNESPHWQCSDASKYHAITPKQKFRILLIFHYEIGFCFWWMWMEGMILLWSFYDFLFPCSWHLQLYSWHNAPHRSPASLWIFEMSNTKIKM